MSGCDNCLFLPVSDYRETGEDRYTWEWKRPCYDCMNTYNMPPHHRYVSTDEAKRLLALQEQGQ